jgi:pimeloyl-ACP methyl ester carboxylesterase
MPDVESADGVKVYYEVLGEGEVPLILVPGLGSAEGKINYKHQLSFATNYPLVLIELPGHGRSGKDREKYTMELFGQDVKAVVDQLNLTNSILVGYSLGGAVIVEAAKLLGERVKGLVCSMCCCNCIRSLTILSQSVDVAFRTSKGITSGYWNN